LPTLARELTSVSNASDTGPSGLSPTERLHFLLAIVHRPEGDIGECQQWGG